MNTLQPDRFKGVDLLCVDEKEFRRPVHYRLVRFNKVHCLRLYKGLDILEGVTFNTSHFFGLEKHEGDIAQNEAALRVKAPRTISVFSQTTAPIRPAAVTVARSISSRGSRQG